MNENTVTRLKKYLSERQKTTYLKFTTFSPVKPCGENTTKEAEKKLSFSLPPLLSEIYSTVANGGFGPGYGVMGITGGFVDDRGNNALDLYLIWRQTDPEDSSWKWPEGHLPICHWGDAVYSVVDCIKEPYAVYFFDPSGKIEGGPMTDCIMGNKEPLSEWLNDWMDGKDLWKLLFRQSRIT
ncbi:hypothetical protein A2673_03625 [Candidatus Kaiserbacteria bacterium RIFCSPHIGHO2_01_FULL_50_13]|nr:MAG: hypothetical protein A2673_03625 [Candidatus Kaiserbacteria bacterium RIFCSPHIGHO2_01_FULL_50_13]